jgi:L-threonylcarbamoyladenylate synthase
VSRRREPAGSSKDVAAAVAALRRGGLVAFPTETVYGLGADATDVAALHRLYAVKRRPPEHPVIVHLGDARDFEAWTTGAPMWAIALGDACWPGPLTLVARRSSRVPDEVTGGQDTVGIRVPDHPLALRLLDEFGGGVAAPSANRFGQVSPTTAQDVKDDLGDDVDVILDGGPCAVGVESTIVDCTGEEPRVLRPGGITAERIETLTGRAVASASTVRAPGMLASHYSPRARVELVDDAAVAPRVAALVADGKRVGVLAARPPVVPDPVEVLTAAEDPEIYARDLYRHLRAADFHGLDVLLVVPPPATGIGVAVNDRLRRAAHAGEPS